MNRIYMILVPLSLLYCVVQNFARRTGQCSERSARSWLARTCSYNLILIPALSIPFCPYPSSRKPPAVSLPILNPIGLI